MADWLWIDRAQIAESFAVEMHEPDRAAIDLPRMAASLMSLQLTGHGLPMGELDELARRTGLECSQIDLRLVGLAEFGIDTRNVHDQAIRIDGLEIPDIVVTQPGDVKAVSVVHHLVVVVQIPGLTLLGMLDHVRRKRQGFGVREASTRSYRCKSKRPASSGVSGW
jgi:hypothetical protein